MLIQKNADLGGNPNGFLFRGRFYSELTGANRAAAEKTLIHKSLLTEASEMQRDETALEQEEQRLRHGLILVLHGSKSGQDVRDALPDELARILDLGHLRRNKPVAWTLEGQVMQQVQWRETRELIDYYMVASLVV